MSDGDEYWMRRALDLARQAAAGGEIPVGAIIVHTPPALPAASVPAASIPGHIIGTGYNRREEQHDPTAHAEIVALRQAGLALGSWRLADCTLYVTLEPCPMCAGALVNARLPKLVYACSDPKAGAVASLYQLCTDVRLNHRMDVTSGIMAEESAALLRSFFADCRARRAAVPSSD